MNYSKTTKLAFTILLFCFGIVSAAGFIFSKTKAPEAPYRYYYKNVAGDVMFDHERHTEVNDVACSSCHHELFSGEIETSCSDCHGEGFSEDMVYQTGITWEDGSKPEEKDFSHTEISEMHEGCTMCHSVSEDVEPKSCNFCHEAGDQKPVLYLCSNCHDDSYSAADFSHGDLVSIHERECGNCHQILGKTGLYHQQCTGCHGKTKPDYFTESGETRCNACHLK